MKPKHIDDKKQLAHSGVPGARFERKLGESKDKRNHNAAVTVSVTGANVPQKGLLNNAPGCGWVPGQTGSGNESLPRKCLHGPSPLAKRTDPGAVSQPGAQASSSAPTRKKGLGTSRVETPFTLSRASNTHPGAVRNTSNRPSSLPSKGLSRFSPAASRRNRRVETNHAVAERRGLRNSNGSQQGQLSASADDLEEVQAIKIPPMDTSTQIAPQGLQINRHLPGQLFDDLEGLQAHPSATNESSKVLDPENPILPASLGRHNPGATTTPANRSTANLAVANLVLAEPNLPVAVQYKVDTEVVVRVEHKRKKERECRCIGATIILVCVIVVVGVILGTRNRRSNNNVAPLRPIVNQTDCPTWAPTFSKATQIQNRIDSVFQKEPLLQNITQNNDSPQGLAYQWLLEDEHLLNYSDARILQRFALTVFYYSTSGDDWAKTEDPVGGEKTKWLEYGSHECDWYSRSLVMKDKYPSIQNPCTPLPLSAKSSVEEEDHQYGHLWMDANDLNGTLPLEIFHYLPMLQTMSLANNSFDGADFEEWVKENPGKDPYAWDGFFSDFDNTFKKGFHDKLPTEIGLLTNLEILSLPFGGFPGNLPSELGELDALREMCLDNNKFTALIPSELALLTALTALSLSFNDLTGPIPSELGSMTALQALYLATNAFTGSIPSELGLLTAMTTLDLFFNDLTGPIPSELGSIAALRYMSLGSNYFTGFIPSELGLLTSLTELSLVGDALTGPIPSELGSMAALQYMYLAGNAFTGFIPSELGLLTALTGLDLYWNDLTGPISSELGSMAALRYMSLYGNSFTGSIPSELGLLTALTRLDLSDHDLTGPIPSELGSMAALQEIDLDGNAFTGFIPSELVLLTELTGLFLFDNDLTAPIPSELGSMAALQEMYLNGNAFTGFIPSELGLLTALPSLSLSRNDLTGPIPSELGSMAALEYMYLYNNSFTGSIPSELGLLDSLWAMYLSDNDLRGTIPEPLCRLGSWYLKFDCSSSLCGCDWCPCGNDTDVSPAPSMFRGPPRD